MKLTLQFGFNEPKRQISWWQEVGDFPHLVLYKGKKWEFIMYQEDPAKQVDHIFFFGEIQNYDPNWYATTYVDIDKYINDGAGDKCDCGAIYTSFKDKHMFFCPKWVK